MNIERILNKGTIMNNIKSNYKTILGGILLLILGGILNASLKVSLDNEDGKTKITISSDYSITLSEQQKPALVENSEGVLEEISAPTVEAIDGSQVLAPESELPDLGQGAYYDISSPQTFKDAAYGQCIDLDGHFGSQCVDLFAAFNLSYTDRWPNVCGTGAARGLWDCRDQNAGDEYELILSPGDLKAGDWAVFGGGAYGHVGMVLGPENGGYVALLGENQGGSACPGGGSSTNIINMSTKTFLGAFRPKIYIQREEPKEEPTIPISNCVQWHLEKGDTLSKIMIECENTIVYGQAMDDYAKTWYSMVYVPGQSVYDGWYKSQNGVGLYEGDDIEHRVEGK